MKNKIISILIILILSLSFTSCSSNSGKQKKEKISKQEVDQSVNELINTMFE